MKYYTLDEAAIKLGIRKNTLFKHIARKSISYVEDPLHRKKKFITELAIQQYKKKKKIRDKFAKDA